MKKIFILTSLLILLSSCGLMNDVVYTPPEQTFDDKVFYEEVPVTYETAWENLMDYTATTFLGINKIEKDAGLVIVSFTTEELSKYITGGHLYAKLERLAGSNVYDGEYLNFYMNGYNYINSFLDCYYNIRLKKITDNLTGIQIRSQYTLVTQTMDMGDPLNVLYEKSWVINTGECNTVQLVNDRIDSKPERTLCPTYIPENEIVNAIRK